MVIFLWIYKTHPLIQFPRIILWILWIILIQSKYKKNKVTLGYDLGARVKFIVKSPAAPPPKTFRVKSNTSKKIFLCLFLYVIVCAQVTLLIILCWSVKMDQQPLPRFCLASAVRLCFLHGPCFQSHLWATLINRKI